MSDPTNEMILNAMVESRNDTIRELEKKIETHTGLLEALIDKWKPKLHPDNTEPDYAEGHIEDCIRDDEELLEGKPDE